MPSAVLSQFSTALSHLSPDQRDPLLMLRQLLADPLAVMNFWPTSTQGMQELLYAFGPLVDNASDADRVRWQTMLDNSLNGSSYTAISVSSEEAWLKAIRRTLCMYDWQDAAIICQSTSAQKRLKLVVSRLRGQEFQDSSLSFTEPPVLLVNQLAGSRFQEIFLSAEFGPSTPRELLQQAVSSARVGLHLVYTPRC